MQKARKGQSEVLPHTDWIHTDRILIQVDELTSTGFDKTSIPHSDKEYAYTFGGRESEDLGKRGEG